MAVCLARSAILQALDHSWYIPPHGSTFVVVTAAADDRTFVVTASPMFKPGGIYVPYTWCYLLRIAPGTGKADEALDTFRLAIRISPEEK